MKTQSNIPLPKGSQRWKDGEYALYINHKDNGVQPEQEEGRRYEAEFTIIKAQEAGEAINALSRMIFEPDLDQKVIDNIEVDGINAINIAVESIQKVSTTVLPDLPTSGMLKKGEIYSYNNGAVLVVQDHQRTLYSPEETPALFSFYRDNSTNLDWMVGEKVEKGWTRTYKGKIYEVLQAHQTQTGWEPDLSPALWSIKIQQEEIPIWKQPTGAHDAYRIGAKVHFPTIDDPVYESVIDYNVYSPTSYPTGWKQIK